MAARVFLHVGLPKTATTYLQTILWGNRELLEGRVCGSRGSDGASTSGPAGSSARTPRS